MNAVRARGSELGVRVASAIVLLAIALSLTALGGDAFAAMCAAGGAIVFLEFRRLAAAAMPRAPALAALVCGAVGVLAWFVAGPLAAAMAFLIGIGAAGAWEFAFRKTLWSAAGLAYAATPFVALSTLRGDNAIGLAAVLLVFAVTWGADILAYFSGRAIGGPKLAPVISPNKTWAGFFGGIVGSVALSAAVAIWAGYRAGVAFIVFSAVLSVISQVGDLFESWLKRRFGAKDSGGAIPGHGGVMDRVDGMVFAAAAAWLFGAWQGGGLLDGGVAARGLISALFAP